ncbi:MAG: alpha/beta fold hydrolase [Polyangiaceae bacterium]|nr:alpha/beta fold hydrolase [Polyangiaceae bacterium]
MSKVGILGAAMASCVGLVGCGDDSHRPASADGASDTGPKYFADDRPAPKNDLEWTRCPLFTDQRGDEAECSVTDMPLRYEEPKGETIPVFVKRYRETALPRRQLWLLNGGPGGSSVDFEPIYYYFTAMAPDLELYFIDHRGTGRSARLGCTRGEAAWSDGAGAITADEWSDCRDEAISTWGDGLNGFTVTAAARDLGTLIERSRHEGEEVYLYSVSYGTYWAQRYLQLYPDQADGVVLDSICSPGECRFGLRYDRLFDATGRRLMALCGEDPACRARLGDDPAQFLADLYEKLDAGHCPEIGLDRAGLRGLLAMLLMYVGVRDYIPSLVYRIDRCEQRDIDALDRLWAALQEISGSDAGYGSVVLGTHIGLSEFMEDPAPTVADAEANVEALLFSPDVGPEMTSLYQEWPRYAADEYVGAFADTDVPLLMLDGEWDPQTPTDVAKPTTDHFTGPHQTYVQMPWSAHTVLTQSPVDSVLEEVTCGMLVMIQFLEAPKSALDTSCTKRVAGIDLDGPDQRVTLWLLGQSDAWENVGLVSSRRPDTTTSDIMRPLPGRRLPHRGRPLGPLGR